MVRNRDSSKPARLAPSDCVDAVCAADMSCIASFRVPSELIHSHVPTLTQPLTAPIPNWHLALPSSCPRPQCFSLCGCVSPRLPCCCAADCVPQAAAAAHTRQYSREQLLALKPPNYLMRAYGPGEEPRVQRPPRSHVEKRQYAMSVVLKQASIRHPPPPRLNRELSHLFIVPHTHYPSCILEGESDGDGVGIRAGILRPGGPSLGGHDGSRLGGDGGISRRAGNQPRRIIFPVKVSARRTP